MSDFSAAQLSTYHFGKHVIFHDEDQCEIRGVVRDRKDLKDLVVLAIELDDGAGWYHAKLMRRK